MASSDWADSKAHSEKKRVKDGDQFFIIKFLISKSVLLVLFFSFPLQYHNFWPANG